jgi:hypothetical protein
MTALLSLAGSVLPVALAGWLIPASVHVTSWDQASARRVVYVPSLESFALPAVIGLGLVAAIAIVCIRRGTLPAVACTLSPLKLFWLWVVPFAPVIGRWFPLTLIFNGPLRWVVAGAALCGVFALWVRDRYS